MECTRLDRLKTLRDKLEESLRGDVGARDMAAVSREYRAVMAEIATLEASQAKVGDPVDEIAARRAARGAVATPLPQSPTAH